MCAMACVIFAYVILLKNSTFKVKEVFLLNAVGPNYFPQVLHDNYMPCNYPDAVDLRIIVIASHRPVALDILLQSLDKLELDGAEAALDIWLDRDKAKNRINNGTLQVAHSYNWSLGVTRVHVWPRHVGIYGQWIDTWCPAADSREMALILEEDIVISPYAWRWLRATRDAFEARDDIAGYTLQSESVFTSIAPRKSLKTNRKHTAFAYRLFGTWGFAPHPRRWTEFVSWYKETIDSSTRTNRTFKPYVDNLIMTSWYKQHEKTRRQDTMWSIWFIYFTNKHLLYTIYNNLNSYIRKGTNYLSVHNSAYGGIHYKQIKSPNATKIQAQVRAKLLKSWDKNYVKFPTDMCAFDYYGNFSKFMKLKLSTRF